VAIAYFFTWTTFGTWLPGDDRGWFKRGVGPQEPNPLGAFAAALCMTSDALVLSLAQRAVVEETIAAHCAIRRWELHAVNCRSNHVHAVVSASDCKIEIPRQQFKSWCTRKLKEHQRAQLRIPKELIREDWWTERGWDEYIDDERGLQEVNGYVSDGQ
jgi:REP element-mobilizing transposase RayT